MIQLTEKAAKQIIEISNAEGIGHFSVRAKIVGGGCAGFTHDLCFDDQVSDMDEVSEFTDYYGTVKVVVDPLSFQYMEDVTIDYIDSPFGGGFKFINPAVTGSCGCGSSVSF
jgi:iron-sulfur cluster insertion protein